MLIGKDDYDFWAIKMRTMLCSQGIWIFVADGYFDHANITIEMVLTIVDKDNWRKIEEGCEIPSYI